jgi:uncharacterized membrane protein
VSAPRPQRRRLAGVVPRIRRSLSPSERADTRIAHLMETLRTGLWFVPGLFVLGAVALAVVTTWIDHRVDGLPNWLAFSGGPTSAQQILVTIAASMMTFTGLVFTISVVVLQLASSQFSPRVLRTFLRDRGSQVPLGIFTATFVYAMIVMVQVRVGTIGPVFVPGLSITVSFVMVMCSLVAFVYFVNHVAQSIRVARIIESVAAETRAVIDAVHDRRDLVTPPVDLDPGECRQVITLDRHGGVLAGLDIEGIIELARRHDCLLWLVRDVGDFVTEDSALFEVYGASGVPPHDVLRQVDIARERSMRQDPAYGFRQLVDIAEKALSPALNDPTTAVQAIDRLHDLLGRVARRGTPSGVYEDNDGAVRFIRPVMSWPGYVALAFEEIRDYGGSSIQVQRRLRSAIDELLDIVPDDLRPPLERQQRLLAQSAARYFSDPEEFALAVAADESGMGNVDEAAPGVQPTLVTGAPRAVAAHLRFDHGDGEAGRTPDREDRGIPGPDPPRT